METARRLDNQIADLLSKTVADPEVWLSLRSRFQVDIFCGLMMASGNDGLSLEPKTLEMLALRGLVLHLDIYDPSPKDSDSEAV